MKNGSSRKKTVIALVAASVLALGAWKAWNWSADQHEAAATQKLVNQLWIERVPADNRDMIGHLVVVKHPRGRFGAAGRSSKWRHFVEVFQWRLDGDKLTAVFPQDRVRTRLKAKTWRCAGEAPEPFELCLRLTSGDRSAMFYSRDEWEVRPHDVEGSLADIEAEMPELAATFDDLHFPSAEDDEEDIVDADGLLPLFE